MSKSEIVIDLGRIGRTNDHEQSIKIFDEEIKLWLQLCELLSSRTYLHEGVTATITTDWSPVLEDLRDQQWREREFERLLVEKGKPDFEIYSPKKQPPRIKFSVTLEGTNKISGTAWYPQFFVEKFLYDVFLICNLSLPGSCEFLNLRFVVGEEKKERYLLSSYNFEVALYDSLDGVEPTPVKLPLRTVIAWYEAIDTGISQKAESSIEKAIYSLLHVCKSEVDETSIIWIFHALEAIYGTRVGEGFTNLINRISLLLELSGRVKVSTKKKLRSMYDYRSSIVHGGYEVHHPLRNEVIDRRLNNDYDKMYDLFQFGFNIIVLSLQKIIENDWYGLEVKENLSGIGMPSKSTK